MAVETFVKGALTGFGLTGYTAAFGSEINSLGIGYSVLSSVLVNNDSPSDSYGQISANLGSAVFPAGGQGLQFFMYPENEDGSYGDGVSSWSPGQPNSAYEIEAFIPIVPGVTDPNVGSSGIFFIPFQLVKFKLAVLNNTGVQLAASANAIYLRTLNRQVV